MRDLSAPLRWALQFGYMQLAVIDATGELIKGIALCALIAVMLCSLFAYRDRYKR